MDPARRPSTFDVYPTKQVVHTMVITHMYVYIYIEPTVENGSKNYIQYYIYNTTFIYIHVVHTQLCT